MKPGHLREFAWGSDLPAIRPALTKELKMTTFSRHFPFVHDMAIFNAGGEAVPSAFVFPPEYADWLYLGMFKHGDLFAESNLFSLLQAMWQACGRDSTHTGVMVDTQGRLLYSIVIIRDLPEVMAIAAALMATHENNEHISDEAYWQMADVHLQRMWAELSIPARLDFARRTNTPTSVVLDAYVSEEHHHSLWTLLYQEMDL